jgi:HAD superfamily hydrolase (TIGR01509 family)
MAFDSPRVTAVLFDVDGTLVDSIPALARGLGDAFEKFLGQRPEHEVLRGLIGRSLEAQMSLFGLDQKPDQLHERMEYAKHRFRLHGADVPVFEPAVQAMEALIAQNTRVALVTSKDREELIEFLKKAPRFQAAHAVVCASDTHRPKPSPDPVVHACSLLGVEPKDAVMIGDSVFDIQSATSAGARAIGVAYGAGDSEALLRAGAERVLELPEDVRTWCTELLEQSYAKN